MSTSEDSFGWATTSKDTDISSDENNCNGDVSTSENGHNEKFQKKMIKQNSQNMNNVNSSEISKSEKRNKKRKIEDVSHDSDIHSPKKKKSKSDPDQLFKKERKSSIQQESLDTLQYYDVKCEHNEDFYSNNASNSDISISQKKTKKRKVKDVSRENVSQSPKKKEIKSDPDQLKHEMEKRASIQQESLDTLHYYDVKCEHDEDFYSNNASNSDISISQKKTKKRKIKDVSGKNVSQSPKKKEIKSDPDQLKHEKEKRGSIKQQPSDEIDFDNDKCEHSKDSYLNITNRSEIKKSQKKAKETKIKDASDESTIHSPQRKEIKSVSDPLKNEKEKRDSIKQEPSDEIDFDNDKCEHSEDSYLNITNRSEIKKSQKKAKETKIKDASDESTIHSPQRKEIKSVSDPLKNEKEKRDSIKQEPSDEIDFDNDKCEQSEDSYLNITNRSEIKKSQKKAKKTKIKDASDKSTIHSPQRKDIKSVSDLLNIKNETGDNTKQESSNEMVYDDDKSEQNEDSDSQTDTKGQLTLEAKYRNAHPRMKAVKEILPENSNITADDDVWVMKCPKEIDIKSLEGINLVLDNKCKMRINGQTYEGRLDEDNTKIPMLSCRLSYKRKSVFFLNGITPTGVIEFKKKLPKPRIVVDNVTDSSFDTIPLPETKCRHPLFGSNYQPFLNLPEHIAQKFQKSESLSEEAIENTSIKKEKKKKGKKIEIEPQPVKKKKNKHRDSEHNSSKVSIKKLKRHSDVTEVWESEKAIEENLFNF